MGITKKPLKAAKKKPKTLTKKERNAKRVSKVQKMLEYRRKVKRSKKNKVTPIKKKRQQEAD